MLSAKRPALFIGSSSEGLDFARAVRTSLDADAEVTVWNEGVFKLGETFIESLVDAANRFDFAVIVLTPDDVVVSRSVEKLGPRDNAIFELGLFMGRIGRQRTFLLHQFGVDLKIPSDLAGVNPAQYHWPRADNSRDAAVASACDKIRAEIRKLGKVEARTGLDLARVKESENVIWTFVSGCEIRAINGRVEDHPLDDSTVMVLPCNEYFDDVCAYDTKSALGAYVNRVFANRVEDFVAVVLEECKKRLGPGVEMQKTRDQRALSFGVGK